MSAKFLRPSAGRMTAIQVKPTPLPAQLPPVRGIDWRSVRAANRACCCPARPAVVVIAPPGRGRDHETELLLCMHHFHRSRAALAARGWAVLDTRGYPVNPGSLAVSSHPPW